MEEKKPSTADILAKIRAQKAAAAAAAPETPVSPPETPAPVALSQVQPKKFWLRFVLAVQNLRRHQLHQPQQLLLRVRLLLRT